MPASLCFQRSNLRAQSTKEMADADNKPVTTQPGKAQVP